MMKRITLCILLMMMMSMTLIACRNDDQEETHTSEKYNHYEVDVYVSDSEKEEWYNAIVKLISNQKTPFGEHGEIMGYEAPRPDEPSIDSGLDMGLFDVTNDGVPELFLNTGGGSAGNDYFYVYDIFSGDRICQVDGGGEKAWAIYYDIENNKYLPVGRYDWRIADSGSMHFLTTVAYDEDEQKYHEKELFYSSFEYDRIQSEEEGEFAGIKLEIDEVLFKVEGESCNFQKYHYELTEFYQNHSLVPDTGLKLYYWSDVSDDDDSYQERAEKMAKMLLYGSGQRFVKQ